jgi:hypothetical protein
VFDINNDGSISLKELKRIVKERRMLPQHDFFIVTIIVNVYRSYKSMLINRELDFLETFRVWNRIRPDFDVYKYQGFLDPLVSTPKI